MRRACRWLPGKVLAAFSPREQAVQQLPVEELALARVEALEDVIRAYLATYTFDGCGGYHARAAVRMRMKELVK